MATYRTAPPFTNLPVEITSYGLPSDEWCRKVETFRVDPCPKHATACAHDRIAVSHTTHLRTGESHSQDERITPEQLGELFVMMMRRR